MSYIQYLKILHNVSCMHYKTCVDFCTLSELYYPYSNIGFSHASAPCLTQNSFCRYIYIYMHISQNTITHTQWVVLLQYLVEIYLQMVSIATCITILVLHLYIALLH